MIGGKPAHEGSNPGLKVPCRPYCRNAERDPFRSPVPSSVAVRMTALSSLVELSEADEKKWRPLLAHANLARSGLVESRPQARMAEGDPSHINRPNRVLLPHEVDRMVALYEEGQTVYELADLFGCHRQTVSRQLKSRGVHMRLTGMTPDQLDEARQLYESGMTLRAVGKAVGASRNHVRTCLAEAGVELRTRTTS